MPYIDTVPLYGGVARAPYYAASGSDGRREQITLQLPAKVVELLVDAERELGIAASDLAAHYIEQEAGEALRRKERFLKDLEDHDRIVGWMPDGTFLDRDSR
jgi:hypothetical protein